MFDFNQRMTRDALVEFADFMIQIQRRIGFKISSRGWCYQLETERIIDKDQFGKVEAAINRYRRLGILPIDFVAEETARQFSVVDEPTESDPKEYFAEWLEDALKAGDYYEPDWWEDEEYYIQLIVEKVDLKTLFLPICRQYHIPIATSKGWSSMSQRAEYTRRFQEAEDRGLDCVLLYCGDHDPDGLRISDFLRKNLWDMRHIRWSDGTRGYDPTDLQIHRFGLNADFIELHSLTWIDNLITGSGKNLASPSHKNHWMEYVQDYLEEFGARKCEANAIVTIPQVARQYVEEVILSYLGTDASARFEAKRQAAQEEILEFIDETGIGDAIQDVLDQL